MAKSTTGCCPPFEPSEWDGQTFVFKDKLFVKFSTRSLLYMPLNMSAAMKKSLSLVEAAHAGNNEEYIMLSDEASPWRSDHYLSVEKEVPGLITVRLSGTYLAKVFEGPYKDARNWYKQLEQYVKSKDKELLKMYLCYTTCPSCAKAYGKNYVVGFAQIKAGKS